ncbi:hypothetical protein Ahy_B10g101400 [Arachis hypogaea]|uniref:Uncharacterized protein n=1 Tax=Arachis hypogaea TaxID=3818 RepID=A0A444WZQ4_ARAHY|nr:hypothetical protein Ahy_B10g101400 [Arachis hypogaea]
MKKIKKINEEAWNYLNKWPMDSWTKSAFSHAPKLDNICNNACEVFNARIKEARAKPIITLLKEVRIFVMRTIAKNKVKLANHVKKLPPMVQSRLDKIRKESKSWMPIWTGDDEYEKFEVHGHPTNMVVDLGKRLCTYQFWMLTAAAAAAAKAKPNAQGNVDQAPTQAPPDAPAQAPPEAPSQAAPEAPAQAPAPVDVQDPPARPSKLQTKKRSSTPPSGSVTMDPLQGASSATSSRLVNFLKIVPTPGFKPPRKKK